jgi:ABC-type Mn/Zn transport systems, ATPase component
LFLQLFSIIFIEVIDVSFAYENRNLLNNISFTIPQGSTTAKAAYFHRSDRGYFRTC